MKLLALMKKEFTRFFRDPRLIVSMILPGILIYIIYSVMGTAMTSEPAAYHFNVYVSGESAVVQTIEQTVELNEGWTVTFEQTDDADAARAEVESGEATALIVFSEGFDDMIGLAPRASIIPAAELVYNSEDSASSAFAAIADAVLDAYGRSFVLTATDYAQSENFAAQMMAGILPFLIVVFVFSSCMSVTLESVAGEKERGTLATILVTSARRWDIALGKVLPLACVSLIGAASSFLGVALSMPALMGVSIDVAIGGIGFVDYLMLFLLIFSFVPLIVAAIAAVSTLSRSVKEASGYTSVIMILMMVLSIVTAFVGGIGGWVIAVPVLNAVSAMQGVLMGNMVVWQCIVSFALNIVYAGVLVFLSARMLSSERIMFGK